MDTLDIPLPDEMPLPPLFPHPSGRPPLPRSPPPLLAPPPVPQLPSAEKASDSVITIPTGEPPPIPTCEPPPPLPDMFSSCEPPPPFPPSSPTQKPVQVSLNKPFHVQPLMAPPPLPKLLMSGYSDSDSEPTSPARGLRPVTPPRDEDEVIGVAPPQTINKPDNSLVDIEMNEDVDDDSRYSPSRVTEDPIEDESVSSDIENLLFESINKAPSPVPPPSTKYAVKPVHPLLGKDQAKKRLVAFAMTKQGGGSGLSFGFIKSNRKSSGAGQGSEAAAETEQAKFDAKMEKPPKPNRKEHRNNIEEIMQYELNLKAQLEKQKANQGDVEEQPRLESEREPEGFRRSRSRSRRHSKSDRKDEQEAKEPTEIIERKKDELPESWSDMKYYDMDFEDIKRIKKVLTKESERRRRRRSRSRSRDRKRSRDHSRRSKSPPLPFKRAKLLHSLLARSKDDLSKEYKEFPGNMVRHTKCEPSVTFCENPSYIPGYYKKRQTVFGEETKETQEIMEDIIHCRIQIAGRADGNHTSGRWYEEPQCFLMEPTEKAENNVSINMDSINGVDSSVMDPNVKEAVKSKWDSDNEADEVKQPIKSLATYGEEDEEETSLQQQQDQDAPDESNPGQGEVENSERDSPMQNPSSECSLRVDRKSELREYNDENNIREVSRERSRMSRSSSRVSYTQDASALMDTSCDADRFFVEDEITEVTPEVLQIQAPIKKSKSKNKKKKAKSRKAAPSDSDEDDNSSDSQEGVKKKKKKTKKIKKVKKSKKKAKQKKKKRKRSHSDSSEISEDESEPQRKKRKKNSESKKKKKKHHKENSSDSDSDSSVANSEVEITKSKKKKKGSERMRSPSPAAKKKTKKKKDKGTEDSGKRKRSRSSSKKRKRDEATTDEENDSKKKKKKKHKKVDDSSIKKLKKKKEKKKKREKRKDSDDGLKEISEEESFQLVKDINFNEDSANEVSIISNTEEHFLEKTPLEEENELETKQLSPVDILISSSPEVSHSLEFQRSRWDSKETMYWDRPKVPEENKWQSDTEESPETRLTFEDNRCFPPMPVACPVPPPVDTSTKNASKTVPDSFVTTSSSNLMAEDLYSPTRALEESSEYSSPETEPPEQPSSADIRGRHDSFKELGGFVNKLMNIPQEESHQESEGKWTINEKGVFIQEQPAQKSDGDLSSTPKQDSKALSKDLSTDSTAPTKAKPIGMKISLSSTSKLKPVGRPAVFEEDDDDSPELPISRLSSLHSPERIQPITETRQPITETRQPITETRQPIPETTEIQTEAGKILENVAESSTAEESYNLETSNQPEDPYIDEMLEEPVNKMPRSGESNQEDIPNKPETPDSHSIKERSKSPSKSKDQRSRSRSAERSRHREYKSKEIRVSRERKDRRRSSSRSRKYRSRSRSRSPRRRYRGRSRSRSRDRRRDRRSPARRRRSRSIERRRRRYSRTPSPHKRTRRSRSRTRKTKSPYRHSERSHSSSYDRRSYNSAPGQPITLTIDDSGEVPSLDKENFNIPIDDIPLPDSDATAVKKRLADSTINDLDLVDGNSGENFWQGGASSKIQWYQMPGAQPTGPESNYLRVGNLLEVVPAAGSKEKDSSNKEEPNKQEWVQQGNLLTVVPSEEGDKASLDKPPEATGVPKIKLPIPDPSKANSDVDAGESSTETPTVTKSQPETPIQSEASKSQPEAAKATTSKAALDMLNKLYGQTGAAGQSVSSQKALEMMSSLLSSISKKSTSNPSLPPPATIFSTAKAAVAEPVPTSKEPTQVQVERKPISASSAPTPAVPATATSATKPTSVPTQSSNAIQVLIDHLTKMTQAPKASPPPAPKPAPAPVPPQPKPTPPKPVPQPQPQPTPPKPVAQPPSQPLPSKPVAQPPSQPLPSKPVPQPQPQPVPPKQAPLPTTSKPTPQPATAKPALTAASLSSLIQQLSTTSQSLSPKAMQLLQTISKMLPQQNLPSRKGQVPSMQKHASEKEKTASAETGGPDRYGGSEKFVSAPVAEPPNVIESVGSTKVETTPVKGSADEAEPLTPLSEHKESLEQRLERESMKQILDKITRSADTQEENARANAIEKQEQKQKEREERRLRKLEKKRRKLKIANTDDLPPPPPPESPPPVVYSSRRYASPPPPLLSDALDIEDQILMREAMEVDVENEGTTPPPQVLPSPDEMSEHMKKKKKKKKKSRESESSALTFRLPLPPKGILVSTGFRDKSFGVCTKVVMFADGVKPGEGASPDTREGMHSPPPPIRLPNKQKKKIRVARIEGEEDDDDDVPPPPPDSPPQFGAVQFQPTFVHPAALQQAVLAAGYQVAGPTGVPVTNYVQFAPMQMMLRGASQTDPRYHQQL